MDRRFEGKRKLKGMRMKIRIAALIVVIMVALLIAPFTVTAVTNAVLLIQALFKVFF